MTLTMMWPILLLISLSSAEVIHVVPEANLTGFVGSIASSWGVFDEGYLMGKRPDSHSGDIFHCGVHFSYWRTAVRRGNHWENTTLSRLVGYHGNYQEGGQLDYYGHMTFADFLSVNDRSFEETCHCERHPDPLIDYHLRQITPFVCFWTSNHSLPKRYNCSRGQQIKYNPGLYVDNECESCEMECPRGLTVPACSGNPDIVFGGGYHDVSEATRRGISTYKDVFSCEHSCSQGIGEYFTEQCETMECSGCVFENGIPLNSCNESNPSFFNCRRPRLACAEGYYNNSGDCRRCTQVACPIGMKSEFCRDEGVTDTCIQCEKPPRSEFTSECNYVCQPGFWGADCAPCPANFFCDQGFISPCPSGTTSSGNTSFCSKCGNETSCPPWRGSVQPPPCSEAMIQGSNIATCECEAGFFLHVNPVGEFFCQPCPPEHYCLQNQIKPCEGAGAMTTTDEHCGSVITCAGALLHGNCMECPTPSSNQVVSSIHECGCTENYYQDIHLVSESSPLLAKLKHANGTVYGLNGASQIEGGGGVAYNYATSVTDFEIGHDQVFTTDGQTLFVDGVSVYQGSPENLVVRDSLLYFSDQRVLKCLYHSNKIFSVAEFDFRIQFMTVTADGLWAIALIDINPQTLRFVRVNLITLTTSEHSEVFKIPPVAPPLEGIVLRPSNAGTWVWVGQGNKISLIDVQVMNIPSLVTSVSARIVGLAMKKHTLHIMGMTERWSLTWECLSCPSGHISEANSKGIESCRGCAASQWCVNDVNFNCFEGATSQNNVCQCPDNHVEMCDQQRCALQPQTANAVREQKLAILEHAQHTSVSRLSDSKYLTCSSNGIYLVNVRDGVVVKRLLQVDSPLCGPVFEQNLYFYNSNGQLQKIDVISNTTTLLLQADIYPSTFDLPLPVATTVYQTGHQSDIIVYGVNPPTVQSFSKYGFFHTKRLHYYGSYLVETTNNDAGSKFQVNIYSLPSGLPLNSFLGNGSIEISERVVVGDWLSILTYDGRNYEIRLMHIPTLTESSLSYVSLDANTNIVGMISDTNNFVSIFSEEMGTLRLYRNRMAIACSAGENDGYLACDLRRCERCTGYMTVDSCHDCPSNSGVKSPATNPFLDCLSGNSGYWDFETTNIPSSCGQNLSHVVTGEGRLSSYLLHVCQNAFHFVSPQGSLNMTLEGNVLGVFWHEDTVYYTTASASEVQLRSFDTVAFSSKIDFRLEMKESNELPDTVPVHRKDFYLFVGSSSSPFLSRIDIRNNSILQTRLQDPQTGKAIYITDMGRSGDSIVFFAYPRYYSLLDDMTFSVLMSRPQTFFLPHLKFVFYSDGRTLFESNNGVLMYVTERMDQLNLTACNRATESRPGPSRRCQHREPVRSMSLSSDEKSLFFVDAIGDLFHMRQKLQSCSVGVNPNEWSTKPSECNCPSTKYINPESGRCEECPEDSFCNGKEAISCPENSLHNGTDDVNYCICRQGFQKTLSRCVPCPFHQFKGWNGDDQCATCPTSRELWRRGGTEERECGCRGGFSQSCEKCLDNQYGFGSQSRLSCLNCSSTVNRLVPSLKGRHVLGCGIGDHFGQYQLQHTTRLDSQSISFDDSTGNLMTASGRLIWLLEGTPMVLTEYDYENCSHVYVSDKIYVYDSGRVMASTPTQGTEVLALVPEPVDLACYKDRCLLATGNGVYDSMTDQIIWPGPCKSISWDRHYNLVYWLCSGELRAAELTASDVESWFVRNLSSVSKIELRYSVLYTIELGLVQLIDIGNPYSAPQKVLQTDCGELQGVTDSGDRLMTLCDGVVSEWQWQSTSCPINHHCNGRSAVPCSSNMEPNNQSGCSMRCRPGFWYHIDECLPCPTDHFCDHNNVQSCPLYSGGGGKTLEDCACDPGFYMLGSECQRCPSHSTSPRGSWSITDCQCENGFYMQDTCKPCGTSAYCTNNTQYNCSKDMHTGILLASSVNDCKCLPWLQRAGDGCVPCTDHCECPPGQYSDGKCKLCPDSEICLGNNETAQCPNSTVTDIMGATTMEACRCFDSALVDGQCQSCVSPAFPARTKGQKESEAVCLCPSGMQLDATLLGCEPCTQGYYCEYNNHANTKTACPIRQTSYSGASSVHDCHCQRKHYRNESDCYPCPEGRDMPEGSSLETCHCSIGTLGDECATCNASSFCEPDRPGETVSRYDCPANSSSAPGSSFVQQCICRSGMYMSLVDKYRSLYKCLSCPAGNFCQNNSINQCPKDYTSEVESKTVFDCYISPGFYSADNALLECPSDHYCASGVIHQCPDNSSSAERSSSIQNCLCNNGLYQSAGLCLACDAGHYCSLNYRFDCPHTFTSMPNSYLKSHCVCQDRHFNNGSHCETCPPGYYCSGGAASICPVNSYCPSTSLQPTACPFPMVSYAGAKALSSCFCPDGQYLDGQQCVTCPINHYCRNNKQWVCSPVQYSGPGSMACIDCPYGERYGSDGTVSDCDSLKTDYYCPANYYCPTSRQTIPCPINHVSAVNSTSINQCVCPSGYSTGCTPCASNSFCPSQALPQTCPENTKSQPRSSSIVECISQPRYVFGGTREFVRGVIAPITTSFTAGL